MRKETLDCEAATSIAVKNELPCSSKTAYFEESNDDDKKTDKYDRVNVLMMMLPLRIELLQTANLLELWFRFNYFSFCKFRRFILVITLNKSEKKTKLKRC